MPEAAEICKLRLFLHLLAQVEGWADIEALSAIDFHIRAGNALVGFVAPDKWIERNEHAVTMDSDFAARYGIDRLSMQADYTEKFAEWQQSHRPFHWCVEFRDVMRAGGFAAIIGNPPYVAYSKVKDTYQVQFYETQACGNLCAYTLERASTLLRTAGRCGMIMPVSAIAGESYRSLNQLLLKRQLWISSYSNRPGKLFAEVEQRLAIVLMRNAEPRVLRTSAYRHWYEPERAHLFATLAYTTASTWSPTGMPLKAGDVRAEAIFSRLNERRGFPLLNGRRASASVWVHNGPTYWVRALPFEPNIGHKSQRSNHYCRLAVRSQSRAFALAAILSSSTFYFFYKMVSNCRDLGRKELHLFPLGELQLEVEAQLANVGCLLARRLKDTAVQYTRHYPSGVIAYTEYYPARAKALLDEIDRILAVHYGFTDEELDFLLNYEIKYRMGSTR